MKKIDFLIPTLVPSHVASCLMQGCHALGCEIYTNGNVVNGANSRGISTPFVTAPHDYVQVTNQLVHELLIVDVSNGLGPYNEAHLLAIAAQRPVVLLNMADGANYRDYDERFIVFTTHLSRVATREGRLFPLAFGLSDDLIALAASADLGHKRNSVIRNFRPTFSQSVRDCLEMVLVEPLAAVLPVDRRETDPQGYLRQLAESSAVCAYGGAFTPDYWSYDYLRKGWEARGDTTHRFKRFDAPVAVMRWDSWRYFEAAVMGCAPLHLDFEKYGFVLPVNPRPWVEYVPIDMATVNQLPQRLADELAADPEFLIRIGRNARQWALTHYSPVAQARQVMETIARTSHPTHLHPVFEKAAA